MFVHQSQDWHRKNRGAGRSTCVQTARLEYMKRFGMADMLFHISSSRKPAFARSAAHQQNTRFCSASRTTGVRIQQGRKCLAEFAFRNAFRQQLLKCLAPIHHHGFAMHLKGDRRTCVCGYSAGQMVDLRSDHPPGAYETIRYGRDVFIALHRGSRHSPGLPLISKTYRFCATGAACPHRYGNTSRSGAGASGARLDWLCGRRRFIASVYWCYSKKCLTLGFFFWYIWDY